MAAGGSIGLFPFLGGTSYYHSLPDLRSSGTLTLGGKATRVRGISWLDRQWGDWNWATLHKWTWMALQLSNGQAVNLWDLFESSGQVHWATVLNPDGSERVVSVNPVIGKPTSSSSASGTNHPAPSRR